MVSINAFTRSLSDTHCDNRFSSELQSMIRLQDDDRNLAAPGVHTFLIHCTTDRAVVDPA